MADHYERVRLPHLRRLLQRAARRWDFVRLARIINDLAAEPALREVSPDYVSRRCAATPARTWCAKDQAQHARGDSLGYLSEGRH